MPYKTWAERKAANARNNKLKTGQRRDFLDAMHHRIESYGDLAAYLRKRGNLHLHWARHSDSYGWILIYVDRTPLCGTERCAMIPLKVT